MLITLRIEVNLTILLKVLIYTIKLHELECLLDQID